MTVTVARRVGVGGGGCHRRLNVRIQIMHVMEYKIGDSFESFFEMLHYLSTTNHYIFASLLGEINEFVDMSVERTRKKRCSLVKVRNMLLTLTR